MSGDKWAGVPTVEGKWFNTVSGRNISLVYPSAEQFGLTAIEDIARALSNIGRYSGQTNMFYSVAEHSVLVSKMVPQEGELPFAGLMHDSSEAYLGDVTSPLKELLPGYKDLENRMMHVLSIRLGFQFPLPEEVEEADCRVFATEALVLFETCDEWKVPFEPYDITIKGLSPDSAYWEFLGRFNEVKTVRERRDNAW